MSIHMKNVSIWRLIILNKKLVADDHGYKWKIKRQIFLEDNLREYFHDFREGKDFLGQKKKTLIFGIELNYIQIKNVHLSNTSKKEWKFK